MIRTLLPTTLLLVTLPALSRAQLTNVEVLGSLAVRCLGEIPGDVDTFSLSPGNRMPYLRPFLTRHWITRGYTVFLDDSVSTRRRSNVYELRYEPQTASVKYTLAERDSLERTVDLSVSHSFVSPQGVLVNEARCHDSVSDMIRANDVARLQQDPWEEARGQVPIDRGWRSWAEPAVIGTSIAVVAYLFFSVRS